VSAVLRVQELAKRYGELQALADVSFEVSAGEIVAIVGPNGAGKTTLLSIIAGIHDASAGSVSVGPEQVGWAPQQAALYSKLSVAENLELFARLERIPDGRAAVERMLEQTGLKGREHERVGRLSGGNRQRVNVALGLIADPPLLALDEPSSALDPGQRERLWEFIESLAAAGRTILFATHNIAEVQRHATRMLLLADGRMLFDGPPAELPAMVPGGDLEQRLVAFLAEHGQPAGAGA